MLLATLTSYIVPLCSWLAFGTHDGDSDARLVSQKSGEGAKREPLKFELRHLHAVSEDARVVFHDVNRGDYRAWAAQQRPSIQPQEDLSTSTSTSTPLSPDTSLYAIPTRQLTTYRPPSFAGYDAARVRSARFGQNVKLNWEEEEIIGPDVEKRETLLLLAKMANDAYVEPNDPAWYELPGNWNIVRLPSTYAHLRDASR